LVPLLGFPYEELREFVERKQNERKAAPKPYSIGQLVLEGSVEGSRGELTATYSITLATDGNAGDEWIRVPLDLQGAVLLEPAAYQGQGQGRVEFDAETNSYVALLLGESSSTHVLKLSIGVPIK